MARRNPDPAALEVRLAYRFADRDHLRRALTHVSGAPGDPAGSNQRLEFLGDRVLGLAVAELLYAAHPAAGEGELSHRLSGLVRREACAAMADRWELGPALHLGAGENQTGGRRNRAILADATEAVLGAVFLDGGYPAARALVERSLASGLDAAAEPARDPKTALQEWVQGRGGQPPTYAILDRSGPDHAPVFRIAVSAEGLASGEGSGRSRRLAEQAAAEAILVREGMWPSPAPSDGRTESADG